MAQARNAPTYKPLTQAFDYGCKPNTLHKASSALSKQAMPVKATRGQSAHFASSGASSMTSPTSAAIWGSRASRP